MTQSRPGSAEQSYPKIYPHASTSSERNRQYPDCGGSLRAPGTAESLRPVLLSSDILFGRAGESAQGIRRAFSIPCAHFQDNCKPHLLSGKER